MTATVFTICSANYLPTVKVLLDSLAEHEAGSQRVLVLVEQNLSADYLSGLSQALNCRVISLEELALPALERMAFQYDVIEFNTAVKPFVFQHLFNEGSQSVIYLDPDICVYQPLTQLWQLLEQHDAVVTPHITQPLPDDGLTPSNENMARCGQYNFGFVAFSQRTAAKQFVDWWAQRLTDHCIFHPDHYYFVDQFYGALVTSFIPTARVWFHQGYNFAYWNASQRTLSGDAQSGWQTPDGPLVFFHFSGFTADDPDALSRYQNRVRLQPGSPISQLALEYRDAVQANHTQVKAWMQPYSFGHYTDGTPIDLLERRAYRDLSAADKAQIASPFKQSTQQQLANYLLVDDAGGSANGMLWQLWQQQTLYQETQEQLVQSQEQSQLLTQQLKQSEELVNALRDSASFRIGQRIVSPWRLLRSGVAHSTLAQGLARRTDNYRRFYREHGLQRTARELVWRTRLYFTRHKRLAAQQAYAQTLAKRTKAVAPLTAHTETVDIVVCIHNALDDVRRCLDSVLKHASSYTQLILVDDGSQAETADYVRQFAQDHQVVYMRNEEAKGYTLAANQGLRASQSDFVILLNSDTIVTPRWLDRMLRCARSDNSIGLVGPLSNTASWQSIPEITNAEGDWAENPLPHGLSIDNMAALLAESSSCQFPSVGFLNGFCFMIRRQLIDDIGLFDEETFARGYGEENDYCLRAAAAGWRLAVADDAYVYHAQSRSYSSERRKILAEKAGQALAQKHGQTLIDERVAATRHNPALMGLRARVAVALADWENKPSPAEHPQKILFLLPVVAAGGGAHVVIQEAAALRAWGVDARLVNLQANREQFEVNYPGLDIPVDYIAQPAALDELLDSADAVVATLYSTVEWIAASFARRNETRVIPGYYIQDFEPYFFEQNNAEYQRAFASYTALPNLRRLTKTQWNRRELLSQCQVDAVVVGCSYNTQLFVPLRPKNQQWPVRVIAMVRPSSPRRGPGTTLAVFKALHEALGDKVALSFFGVDAADPALADFDTRFPHNNLGELSAPEVAQALDNNDVFLDFSSYQAMGLTALEAMACGLAVTAPQKGGASEFINHGTNGLLLDTSNKQNCISETLALIQNAALRQQLGNAALRTAPQHSPKRAAMRLLRALA